MERRGVQVVKMDVFKSWKQLLPGLPTLRKSAQSSSKTCDLRIFVAHVEEVAVFSIMAHILNIQQVFLLSEGVREACRPAMTLEHQPSKRVSK
jgi:hypothetical protein